MLFWCKCWFFDLLLLLNNGLVRLRNVVNELASHAIWAVPVGGKLLAKLGFVEH